MIYTIQAGDTLFSIAQRYHTTIDAIVSINPQILDIHRIYQGQTILLPSAVPIPFPGKCPLLKRGATGDAVIRLQSLLRIAGFNPGAADGIFGARTHQALLAFQRSVRELEVTGDADLDTWTALGAECYTVPGLVRYVVRPGDSLFIISNRFNVPIDNILRANPAIANPNLLYTGQIINIPINA